MICTRQALDQYLVQEDGMKVIKLHKITTAYTRIYGVIGVKRSN